MALSIFTSASAMSSINALNKSNNLLSTAMERLSTGKRINSSADDAAGLQIASRLQGQSNGMGVAQRNISDATSMLQTAEGAFDEVSNIMYRMKDLATQAANDTNSAKDRDAIKSELTELSAELNNIMANTSFAGEKLTASGGKLSSEVTFQIGSSAGETMTINLSSTLAAVQSTLTSLSGAIDGISTASGARALMTTLEGGLEDVGSLRSNLGASVNRLGHTAANLANMKDNTDLALGNIRDTDYAIEVSSMSRNSMLAQTSMSMLKQSNQISGLAMSLL